MKRAIIGVSAIALVGIVIGIGISVVQADNSDAKVDVDSVQPLVPRETTAADNELVRTVRSNIASLDDEAEVTLTGLAQAVCNDLQSGKTLVETVTEIKLTLSLTDSDASSFTGAATKVYCPQYAAWGM